MDNRKRVFLADANEEFRTMLQEAINADEMVHPMVNGGHHITEFLLS